MAYSPSEKYPGAVDVDPDYQGGKFRDNNPSTTNNGSPLKAIDRNELLARDEAIMNDAGFEYSGVADTPQDSQLFKAYKASFGNGANLLSNHNFLIQTPDDSQPLPSATPTSYPPGYQIFSSVFANETTGITNLTYIDGRVSFSGGDLYFSVPNTGAIARLTSDQLTVSVADFDGKPRARGVSFALVGDEYRVTVGIDALEDAGATLTPLGSVKFERGSVATGHEVVEPLTAQTIGGVTNYQTASVADMKEGKALKAHGVITPDMIDSGDISISTQGYYGSWAAMTEPQGAASYILTTLQIARDSLSDPTWEPDGWGDHYLFSGADYVAMLERNDYIELKQYGAKPYVSEDQSLPFIAAWKAATTQTVSTFEVSSKGLNLGVGVFEIRQNSFLSETGFDTVNGRRIIIKGEGFGQSVLIFRPTVSSAYMYDQRVNPDVHFNGLQIRDLSIRFKNDLNGGGPVHGFYCESGPSQINQHFQYKDLHVTCLPTSNWFETKGVFQDDLSVYENCRIIELKSLLVIDNGESVAHRLTNTDISDLYGFAFSVGAGGLISMIGGAVQTSTNATQECGLIELGSPVSSSPNAGTPFSFQGVRMERRTANSRVLRCLAPDVRQAIVFETCNFGNASFNNAFAIVAVANKLNVVFDDCTLPLAESSKFAFLDNPSPAAEYAQNNLIESVVTFKGCRRFGGAVTDAEYYADFSNVTMPTTQQGQVVVYEGNKSLPNTIEYGTQFGTGMSYPRKAGGFVQFRGFTFPHTDGVTPTNPNQYFNLQVAQFAYVKEVTVSRASLPSGGIPVVWEIVDGIEFNNPGTGVIYGESPTQNMNDEWNWTLQVTKRLSGTIDERTLWLRQKPSDITTAVPASNIGDGQVFAVVM